MIISETDEMMLQLSMSTILNLGQKCHILVHSFRE